MHARSSTARTALAAWLLLLGAPALPAHAEEHSVSQVDKEFSASEITIRAGDSIVFKNEDSVAHNIFSRSEGFRFNLKKQEPGAEDAIPFEKAGVAEVRCAIHPRMKLIVTVEP